MPQLPRPRFLIAAIAAVALIGGTISLTASTWSDHDATLAEWTRDLSLSARLVEAQMRAQHGEARGNLIRIEDHVAARPLSSLHDSPPDQEWLDSLLAGIPNGFAICLFDDKANQVLTTDRQGLFAQNAASQDYIILALAQPGKTVTTALWTERGERRHLIAFSRTLIDQSGRVRGIAKILIASDSFAAFYHPIVTRNPGSIFTVARTDGDLIVRLPMPESPHFRFDTAKHPFIEFSAGAEGNYRTTSMVDGAERLISFRHLPDLDLVVLAGVTMDAVFRDWTIRTQRNATRFAIGMLLLLTLAMVTSESLRHEGRLLRSFEQKAAELTAALADKDMLFQEVHHRVKNNLQVISSLLTMQSLHVSDDMARATLKDALDRIHSMGLVHQTLYERNLASNVDLGVYFGRLAEALVGSYGLGKGSVSVHVDVAGTLDLDRAVPLGMLANEALSNALKHAFPDGRNGTIAITLTRDETQWHFTIRDDGIGMPAQPSKGIGLSLIRALTRQLNGRSAISKDGGTVVIVTFPV